MPQLSDEDDGHSCCGPEVKDKAARVQSEKVAMVHQGGVPEDGLHSGPVIVEPADVPLGEAHGVGADVREGHPWQDPWVLHALGYLQLPSTCVVNALNMQGKHQQVPAKLTCTWAQQLLHLTQAGEELG
jgi:hypothetical protein